MGTRMVVYGNRWSHAMHAITFLGLSLAVSGSLAVSLDTSFPAGKRADFMRSPMTWST